MTDKEKLEKQILIMALKLAIKKGKQDEINQTAEALRNFMRFEHGKYHNNNREGTCRKT